MKRLLYILLLLPLGLSAQNMYNVTPFLDNDLIGTARFVGMGGSMSALGADLSTMSVNPAGMALFRGNDFSLTGGLMVNKSSALYEGAKAETSKTLPCFSNLSLVLSMDLNDDYLKFLNLGFAYRKKNNLSGNFEMEGLAGNFSQQYIMEQLYRSNPFDVNKLSSDMYDYLSYNWLTLLAAEAYLGDSLGNFITYPDTSLVWLPDEIGYYQEQRGGVDAIDINLSANISDRFYLGTTVGIYNVDYSRYSSYSEYDSYGPIYTLENKYVMKGAGFDIKLGAIVRPFKYSPFKVGVSVHTPIWYTLDEYTSATITDPYGKRFSTTDYYLYNGDYSVRSKLSTPWRVNASMSYTFGTYLALNAEYEFADYSATQYTSRSYVTKAQNEEIKYNLKNQHIARVGAELNIKGFALRAGYNYSTAPFKSDAYKNLGNANVTDTSTEYMNLYDKHTYTLGCGYHGKTFYFDMAYMQERQNAEFFPFYDMDFVNPGAKVALANHTAVATVGVRF